MPRLVQEETLQSCFCQEKWQSFYFIFFRGNRTTKTSHCAKIFASIFGTQGSTRAISCRFDGALGHSVGPQIYNALHRVVTLSEKMYRRAFIKAIPPTPTPASLPCFPHQPRFASHSLWNMIQMANTSWRPGSEVGMNATAAHLGLWVNAVVWIPHIAWETSSSTSSSSPLAEDEILLKRFDGQFKCSCNCSSMQAVENPK